MASFICDDGYKLSGSNFSVCQTSKTWSEPTPSCTQSNFYIMLLIIIHFDTGTIKMIIRIKMLITKKLINIKSSTIEYYKSFVIAEILIAS